MSSSPRKPLNAAAVDLTPEEQIEHLATKAGELGPHVAAANPALRLEISRHSGDQPGFSMKLVAPGTARRVLAEYGASLVGEDRHLSIMRADWSKGSGEYRHHPERKNISPWHFFTEHLDTVLSEHRAAPRTILFSGDETRVNASQTALRPDR